MTEDSWESHRFLPPGWRFKEGPTGPELLSSTNTTFPSLSSALKHIRASCSQEEIDTFKKFINPKTRKAASSNETERSKENIKEDQCVENGNVDLNNDSMMTIKKHLLELGSNITFKPALEIKPTNFEEKIPSPKANKSQTPTPSLPANRSKALPVGWKRKVAREKKQVAGGKVGRLQQLLRLGGNLPAVEKVRAELEGEGWRKEGLPAGWMARTEGQVTRFLASDGRMFEDKQLAMAHLIQLDGGLEQQGQLESWEAPAWASHPLLPPGWRVAPGPLLEAPGGHTFTSHRAAAAHMEEHGGYSDSSIQKLYRVTGVAKTTGGKPASQKPPAPANQKPLPASQKAAAAKCGRTGRGVQEYRRAVARGDRGEVGRARAGLREQGWSSTSLLPEGWLFRPQLLGPTVALKFLTAEGEQVGLVEARKLLPTRVLDAATLREEADIIPEMEIKMILRNSEEEKPSEENTEATKVKKPRTCDILESCDLVEDFRDVLNEIAQFRQYMLESEKTVSELMK